MQRKHSLKFFYAIQIVLRLFNTLIATVRGSPCNDLNKNSLQILSGQEILNQLFWKQVYNVLCCIYPVLISLYLSYSKNPDMGQINYFVEKSHNDILRDHYYPDDKHAFGET